MRVIDRVLNLAEARGWNQTVLADKMHVSSASITNWKAREDMPADQLVAAADALRCSVDELLGRQGPAGTGQDNPLTARAREHFEMVTGSFADVDLTRKGWGYQDAGAEKLWLGFRLGMSWGFLQDPASRQE